jgi:hypothetical protein
MWSLLDLVKEQDNGVDLVDRKRIGWIFQKRVARKNFIFGHFKFMQRCQRGENNRNQHQKRLLDWLMNLSK